MMSDNLTQIMCWEERLSSCGPTRSSQAVSVCIVESGFSWFPCNVRGGCLGLDTLIVNCKMRLEIRDRLKLRLSTNFHV